MKASALSLLFLYALCAHAVTIDNFNTDVMAGASGVNVRSSSVTEQVADFIGGVREITARVETLSSMSNTNLVECTVEDGRLTTISDPATLNRGPGEQSGCVLQYSGAPFSDFGANPINPPIDFVGSGCDAWVANVLSATPENIEIVVNTMQTGGSELVTANLPEIAAVTLDDAVDVVIPFSTVRPPTDVTVMGFAINTFGGQNAVLNHFCCSTIVLCEHTVTVPANPIVGNTGTASVVCTNTGANIENVRIRFFISQMVANLTSATCSVPGFMPFQDATGFDTTPTQLNSDAAVTCTFNFEFVGVGTVPEQNFFVTNLGNGIISPSTAEQNTRNTFARCNLPVASPQFVVQAAPTTQPPTTQPPTTIAPTLPPTTTPPTTTPPTTEAPTLSPTTLPPVNVPTTSPPTTTPPTTEAPTLAPTLTPTAAPTVPPDNVCVREKANFFDPCATCACSRCSRTGPLCSTVDADSGPLTGSCFVVNSGFVVNGGITGTDGDDCIWIESGVTVIGAIDLQAGDDCLIIADGTSFNNEIDLGPGRDCFSATGATFEAGIFGDTDGDKITVIDSVALEVFGDEGGDCLEILGTATTTKRDSESEEQTGARSLITFSVDGGPGIDCIRVQNSEIGETSGFEGEIRGGTERDCIVAFDSTFNSLQGNEGNDIIQVSNYQLRTFPAANDINGGMGDDCMIVRNFINTQGFNGIVTGDVGINTCDLDATVTNTGCDSNFEGSCPRSTTP